MKKSILTTALIVVLLVVSIPACSQRIINNPYYDDEPYHFGFVLGLNTMQYALRMNDGFQQTTHNGNEWPGETGGKLNVYNIVSANTPGFSVGIVGNLRLGNYFDLRFVPTLSFGERKTEYTFNLNNDIRVVEKSIFSTFVELPLLLKYKSRRVGNIRGFVVAGPNYKLDLASQKANEIETDAYGTVVNNINVKKTDLALDFGGGFDFYTAYFKFGVEIKISYGLNSILVPDEAIYTTSFDNVHNKVYMLSFTFE